MVESQSSQSDAGSHARKEGKRTKLATSHKTGAEEIQIIGGDWKFQKKPKFLAERTTYFNELYAAQEEKYAAMPQEPITVTLPDGNAKQGVSFKTTPLDVAKMISNQLVKKIIVAQVRYPQGRIATLDDALQNPEEDKANQGEGWMDYDATRPLEGNCEIKLLQFSDDAGRETFWHSSAHVLGETLEVEFGVHLTHGPPTEDGFFYDSYTGKDIFNEKNYATIEKVAKKICSDDQKFQRLVLTKQQALTLFKANPFKIQTISSKIQDGKSVTAYKCGDLIDLCTGPHIPTTKLIKGFKVMRNSAAYWLGKATNDSLQRIYAISFPSQKEMDEYIHFREEAEKRDHRIIGKQQQLFTHFDVSPGCAFWYPKGTHIYNKLMDLCREQYRIRGYHEVVTPNMYNLKLWKTSGHYQNYKENMFLFRGDEAGHGLKSMNCPAHCVMFEHGIVSYRDLPMRLADFGVLHRNEISGALCGLIRVRRFQQDDAHIFCTQDQIAQEIFNTLDFLEHIYSIFDFRYELQLSTRPANRLGTEEQWDIAEAALEAALNKIGKPWTFNHGDGAFYGPKIDIQVYDALKRKNQCGTIQVDFQQPIRFNLQYQHENAAEEQAAYAANKDKQVKKVLDSQEFPPDEHDPQEYTWHEMPLKPGFKRPVIIHRAILGSVERFTAVLTEHLAGKWPFWLSPRQVIVCPISEKAADYCESIYLYLHKLGFQAEIDRSQGAINKKVRNAQLAQWNYILVAGEEEMKACTVDVRTRDTKRHGKKRIDELVKMLDAEKPMPAKQYDAFYANAFDPAKHFKDDNVSGGAQAQAQQKPVAVAGAAANGSSDRNFSKKLDEIEQELSCGAQWLSGGNMPGADDAEAFKVVANQRPDPRVYPHAFSWYAMVSKFSPEKQAAWK